MNGDPLVRAKELFADALERPIEEREGFIAATCADDTTVRQAVLELLAAHTAAERFMYDPAPGERGDHAGALAPGTRIGRYELRERIGEGGFGTVYLARQDAPVRRDVALKVIKPGMDTHRVVARFEAERQALAVMEHPSIARVLDGGATDEGRPYFVMEVVRGVPITEHCQQSGLAIDGRLELFVQVCDAVQHAHQKGIIHRDLKPSNVLVVRHGTRAIPKIIDFGIAKAMNRGDSEESTVIDGPLLIGTPQYISPEQAESGGRDVDTRSDIYALGVLLYELLTDTLPFPTEVFRDCSIEEIRRIIRDEDPVTPSARLATTRRDGTRDRSGPAPRTARVRGDLDWIVMRCLEKDPQRRYATAASLASDVRRHLRGEPVHAAPPSRLYRARKVIRRHRVAVGAGVLVALSIFTGAAVSVHLAIREAAARREAEARAHEARLVAEFQGRMLRQVDAASVGGRLFQDLRDRYHSALSDQGVPEGVILERVGAFDLELARVNSTDAAAALIDEIVLRPAVEAIETDFGSQPVIASTLRHTVSELYSALGMYPEALSHEEQTLAIRRRELGDDHPDTLTSVQATGELLHRLGRRAEATELAREAWEGRRLALGPDAPETLVSQSSYGAWLEGEEHAAEAERLCREAVTGLRTRGPAHEAALQQALQLLAGVLRARGKQPEAEPLLLEAIELAHRSSGAADPRIIDTYNEYGNFLFHQRRWDECAAYTKKTLEIARRVWGENHQDTVFALWNLGFLLEIVGRPAEAEPYLREFRERRRRAFGDSDGWVLNATKELATVLLELQRPQEAKALLTELDVPDLMNRPELPSVLGIRIRRGRALLALGRHAEAEAWLRATVELAVATADEGSNVPHSARCALGQVLAAQGRWEEAETVLQEAVAGYAEDLGEPFNGTIRARVTLGRVLMERSRWSEAREQLDRADASFPGALAVTPKRHKVCVELLAELYERWHRADPAAGHDAKAASCRERLATMPDRHPPIPDLPPA